MTDVIVLLMGSGKIRAMHEAAATNKATADDCNSPHVMNKPHNLRTITIIRSSNERIAISE